MKILMCHRTRIVDLNNFDKLELREAGNGLGKIVAIRYVPGLLFCRKIKMEVLEIYSYYRAEFIMQAILDAWVKNNAYFDVDLFIKTYKSTEKENAYE